MVGRSAFKSLGECDLFIAGQEGHHTYRIPALVVSGKGTILAFCEGRRYSADDAGKIDLVLRRSIDHVEIHVPYKTG